MTEWECPLCNGNFTDTTLRDHIIQIHIGSNHQDQWGCGQCIFKGDTFDQVGIHCLRLNHDAELITYRSFDKHNLLSRALKEIQLAMNPSVVSSTCSTPTTITPHDPDSFDFSSDEFNQFNPDTTWITPETTTTGSSHLSPRRGLRRGGREDDRSALNDSLFGSLTNRERDGGTPIRPAPTIKKRKRYRYQNYPPAAQHQLHQHKQTTQISGPDFDSGSNLNESHSGNPKTEIEEQGAAASTTSSILASEGDATQQQNETEVSKTFADADTSSSPTESSQKRNDDSWGSNKFETQKGGDVKAKGRLNSCPCGLCTRPISIYRVKEINGQLNVKFEFTDAVGHVMRSHIEDEPYRCKDCPDIYFRSIDRARSHSIKKHDGNAETEWIFNNYEEHVFEKLMLCFPKASRVWVERKGNRDAAVKCIAHLLTKHCNRPHNRSRQSLTKTSINNGNVYGI